MAIRLKARSTTPGDVRLASGVLAQLIAVANIVDGVGRGDGGTGTYPTTAATQATDAGLLTAATLDVDGTNSTVAFGASNGTAKTKAVWDAALVVQLAADVAILDANVDEMIVANATLVAAFGCAVGEAVVGGGGACETAFVR